MAETPRKASLSRRAMLTGVGAAATAVAVSRIAGAQTPDDPTKLPGRDPNELGTRSQFEQIKRLVPGTTSSRTPLDALNGIITPSDVHYERHHAGVPVIDPNKYSLLIHGMVGRPMEFTLTDLKRFPSVSRIMFLECSGNTSWGKSPDTATAQALHGLTSTSEWTGVPVKTLLAEVGAQPGAMWALAEGMDGAVMTRSVPMAKLMDDALIAYGQNGEAIRPEQGYPARLLLPGWEGNISVKWLRRLKLGDQPFQTREETSKYTDPMPDGKERQFTFVMEAKSTITWPTAAIGQMPGLGPWEIRGIAWSGMGRITKVEVSTDGGKTWNLAALEGPVLPISHTRFRYLWNWTGVETVLQSRAYDESGFVQPSRAELVAARGEGSIYHYNGIQSWRVDGDGRITNVYV